MKNLKFAFLGLCLIGAINFSAFAQGTGSLYVNIVKADSMTNINSGMVYLYGYNAIQDHRTFYDTTSIKAGANTYFPSIDTGEYFVLVKPDLDGYPDYVSTYADSSVFWQDADVKTIDLFTNQIVVYVQRAPEPGTGNAVIRGKVVEGNIDREITGKTTGAGDPFDGVDVTLIKKPANTRVGHDISDTAGEFKGEFSFDNVDTGDYYIYVNVPGIPVDPTFTIAITSNNDTIENIIATVDSVNGVTFKYGTTAIPPVIDKEENLLSIYPNPFNNSAQITYTVAERSNVELAIYDITGSKVAELVNATRAKGQYHLNFEPDKYQLSAGVYLLKLSVGDSVYSQRLIRND